ncbi:large conductance mechanosensitive channel protein MscL [Metamycoplasma equirhinis]|uniref:large conductance mechanosensitive channel protein MscL n=1 Tax=Metamycoplasma equirhinis TaxID=92402 RepID=UPI0035949186
MTQKELNEKSKICKKSFLDAKKVVLRGNMFMLAIGLLLGAAFGALVTSLANDVIMAAITRSFSLKVDAWVIWPKYDVANNLVGGIYIGKFLSALLNFIIVSTFIFLGLLIVFLVKNAIDYSKAKKMPIEPELEPQPTNEELMLKELKRLNEQISKLDSKK